MNQRRLERKELNSCSVCLSTLFVKEEANESFKSTVLNYRVSCTLKQQKLKLLEKKVAIKIKNSLHLDFFPGKLSFYTNEKPSNVGAINFLSKVELSEGYFNCSLEQKNSCK